jgi:hypothetical protein
MREWEVGEPVDSVISCCDCLNYLTEEEELAETFRQTYAGLKQGGTFIFDVHTEHQLITYAEMQPFTLNEEDVSYIWTSEIDEERCEIEHHLTIFVSEAEFALTDPSDQPEIAKYVRIDETHVQRAYPLSRIEALLGEAGFAAVRVFADFTRKAPAAETERAFFVCVKR